MRVRQIAGLLALAGSPACLADTSLPPDTRAPEVTITAPLAGATVSGGVSVDVSAVDDNSVEAVRIRIDGTLLGTFYTRPYHVLWSTFGLPNNTTHTIVAEADDASSNIGRAQISVSVFNDRQ